MIKKVFFSLICGTAVVMNLYSQKLPNVQKNSRYAPLNVKIDGKATEWDDKFQAYNTATEIFYTMANDEDNLYVVMQVTNPYIINTIVGYGLQFVIQSPAKKDDKNSISITYPVTNNNSPLDYILNTKRGFVPDTTAKIADAVMNANNQTIEKHFKYIVVTGIKGLDTLSVYNDQGIKAIGLFDNKRVYTIEMCLPLKYLILSGNSISKFTYHVLINGFKPPDVSTIKNVSMTNSSPEDQARMQQAVNDLNMQMAKKYAATDFSGDYTLAKKP